jgi:hypothetical protein
MVWGIINKKDDANYKIKKLKMKKKCQKVILKLKKLAKN